MNITQFNLFVIIVCFINLIRVAINVIGSEVYDIKEKSRKHNHHYQPLISVIIPAFNEASCIIRTLTAAANNDYKNKEIWVVDDGSTDKTAAIVNAFLSSHDYPFCHLITQENGGKSRAINNAVKNYAKGDLIMVLDADSSLAPTAIGNMVQHFSDPKVIGMAANVKMMQKWSILGMVQRIEFLTAYRGKSSEDMTKMLYIIGGVGSTFRRSIMLDAGLYDTDTVTEDIDFTLKAIEKFGNVPFRFGYAANCVVYTEPVSRFSSLFKQRFRWKYGRFKAFVKYHSLFFNRNKKYSKTLTWFTLPQALIQELFMLIEPVIFLYLQYLIIVHMDFITFINVITYFSILTFLSISVDKIETFSQKIILVLILPFVYFGMFLLTIVEYLSLARSIFKTKTLLSNSDKHANWQHVERLNDL